ncbi:SDR family NAD(P)-dependent oxidoreductase [Mycolicibacterium fluoranthenivorans]|jgi:NAD(P)-dependent dehydrogenase (short-subunit alcohol dehydrogenase family)|uniref:SDR family NAD(P)-dependent oxidoreductase n=1 Tax=Mycolicibacterium fluoranthenivorans TaxID=258505 RepID=A0A7G8PFK2_9MYCO|nr:oxidoreductase [Mycolicibacterium fluoranthenivorans]QNJ93118.1 SDR family NAD(P)-dependent oxidoreductase [Mycolicibacterium fluoranthenivorans]
MTVWFITGASRGFGLAIARAALGRGDSVVATARNLQALAEALPAGDERLLTVELDVHRPEQIAAAVDAAVAAFGRIDALVNNAGRGLVGAVEETSDAEARAVFDVNVFGLLAVTRAVLPEMRAQGSGLVINVSSVGGFVAWPGWGVYCATKFAVEGLSDAMKHELEPLGIKVTAIEPGPFRTDFLDGSSLHIAATEIADYASTGGAARTWAVDNNAGQAGDPEKAAAIIVGLASEDRLPERIQLGANAVHDIADKLARTSRDLEQWREVALSADF